MKASAIVSSILFTANFSTLPAIAACIYTAESTHTIVRGRFVRGEDASFHLEASGAYQRYQRDLEAAVSRVEPEDRDELVRRLGISSESPINADFEARVAVVAIDWHAPIVPWDRETSETVEFRGQPREFAETIRFWWRGSIESCDSMAASSSVDLWVYSECCDTLEFGAPVCIVQMDYAEPAPEAMSQAMSQVLSGP